MAKKQIKKQRNKYSNDCLFNAERMNKFLGEMGQVGLPKDYVRIKKIAILTADGKVKKLKFKKSKK